MAQLTFEKILNLTTDDTPVDRLMVGNEPENDLVQYYMNNVLVHDKTAKVTLADYDSLSWSVQRSTITSKQARSYGMKTFPRVGAIGFYSPLVGTSKILAPIHIKGTAKYAAPTLAMTDNGTTLTFRITPPQDIEYTCYRILLQRDYDAFEYITYELELTIDKPTVKGRYSCYCIGYVAEGSNISEDSNSLTLVISTGSDMPEPKGPRYYTAAEIDAIIGNIGQLLDSINGEVI